VLLQLRERDACSRSTSAALETEEQPRLIAAVAARMPRGKQDRQAQPVLRLVEIRGSLGARGASPRPLAETKQRARKHRDSVEQRAGRGRDGGVGSGRETEAGAAVLEPRLEQTEELAVELVNLVELV
jgi:hypothetical protein